MTDNFVILSFALKAIFLNHPNPRYKGNNYKIVIRILHLLPR